MGASLAHALHDGYTDLLYVLLPVWQSEFHLSFRALAALRGIYTGAAAGLQVPASALAERLGLRFVLVLGTLLACAGYALSGSTNHLAVLCAGLFLCGLGSSTQHPVASTIVARAYGEGSRGPLGTYNFAGDLGKATLPALTSWLISRMPWPRALRLLAMLGVCVTVVFRMILPADPTGSSRPGPVPRGMGRPGFSLLVLMGALDSGVRMGFLTFLPFLLKAKGATLEQSGLALSMLFVGGAAGKFVCGWLGQRWGFLTTVVVSEACTGGLILAVLALPLAPVYLVLPVLGSMLNGTSSVFYGTVPDFAPTDRPDRAFALFYTATLGSGALSPVIYGWVGDSFGATRAVAAAAAVALLLCPLAGRLSSRVTGSV